MRTIQKLTPYIAVYSTICIGNIKSVIELPILTQGNPNKPRLLMYSTETHRNGIDQIPTHGDLFFALKTQSPKSI